MNYRQHRHADPRHADPRHAERHHAERRAAERRAAELQHAERRQVEARRTPPEYRAQRTPEVVEALIHDMRAPKKKSRQQAAVIVSRVKRLNTKWFTVIAGLLLGAGIVTGVALKTGLAKNVASFGATFADMVQQLHSKFTHSIPKYEPILAQRDALLVQFNQGKLTAKELADKVHALVRSTPKQLRDAVFIETVQLIDHSFRFALFGHPAESQVRAVYGLLGLRVRTKADIRNLLK